MIGWQIVENDLTGEDIIALLAGHASAMLENSPAGSTHFLNLEQLRGPDSRFWSIHQNGALAGCGALKQLDGQSAEVKSMRTAEAFLRKGAAGHLLEHMIHHARVMGLEVLYLETGTSAAFTPAHALYRKYGFEFCGPFGDYQASPHNIFMMLKLR